MVYFFQNSRSFSDLCKTLVWKEVNIAKVTTKLPELSLLMDIRDFPSLFAGLARDFVWK